MDPLFLTLKVAAIATLAAFHLGILLAYLLAHSSLPGKKFVEAFLTLPMVLPPTVLGYYLIVFLGRNGWVGKWLNEQFRDIAHVYLAGSGVGRSDGFPAADRKIILCCVSGRGQDD